jgi:hypothetical protein
MKISLSLICSVSLILAVLASNVVEGQQAHQFGDYPPVNGGGYQFSGDLYGGQAPMQGPQGGPGARNASSGAGAPGRLWLRGSVADRGLGYTGSYFTVGAKNRLFEDRFDGRWLIEGRAHHSLEDDGGFFSNIGLERIFSIDAAEADVSMGVWYDYDGDARGEFAHEFHQIGVTGQIKTRKWDLIGNGYIPVGTTDYAFGDPNGVNCFAGNRIVLIPGIDSALQGFDTVVRMRPEPLGMVNGTIDLGGYHYRSDLVGSFAGGRARLGMQMLRGLLLSAEVNHDDRFETTGVLQAGWLFGANASGRGSEYASLGRDLDSVTRNDHIVRFNQDAVVLRDPLTGAAYNVVHVDNNADAALANGSAERPFATLLDAQVNSNPFDVIAVNLGDGTDRNMDQGIVLQDNQRLWGVGVPFLVPNADGTLFNLCGVAGADRPTISNAGGVAVVTLANNNDVAGINIDATGATFGVLGTGDSGSIRSNEIRNAASHGVSIANATGDWQFDDNLIENNGGSGIAVENFIDPTGVLSFNRNTANDNLLDGLAVLNATPESLAFIDNITNGNARHGLHVNNYTFAGTQPLTILNHTSSENLNRGIMLDQGTGPIRVFNTTSTNNTGAGLTIRNWDNLDPTHTILIGNQGDGASDFSGNGALGNIELLLETAGLVNNVSVSGIRSDNGVRGLYARAEGVGTILNIDILDNVSFNNNVNDGIRLMASESGIVNTRIGSTNVNFRQNILDNAFGGGSGIALIAEGTAGSPAAQMNAVIDNVFINNRFNIIVIDPVPPTIIEAPTNGVELRSLGSAVANVSVLNSQIGAPNTPGPAGTPARNTTVGVLIETANDGAGLINRFTMDNLEMFNDIGVDATTSIDTFTDISLANSILRPDGIQSDGTRSSNVPFGDGRGSIGVSVRAVGQGVGSGQNIRTDRGFADPLVEADYLFSDAALVSGTLPGEEIISDGNLDNLTRVQLLDNSITDFHENGVEINSFGDAQLLLNLVGNEVSNNGAGFNSDSDNDNVYNEAGDNGAVDVNNLSFFDGVRIHAFDQSTLSANIFQNTFVDNFERGLRINTFGRAIINASMRNNVFFGNDRGEDVDNTVPDLGTGVFSNNALLADSGIFDFEAVNNSEFYIRAHESPILLDGDGAPIDLFGNPLPADTLGVFYPGNVGVDIFGNPTAFGAAQLNLSMTSNSLQLPPPDLLDFSVAPGSFTLGLDGATNGFVGPVPGITPVPLNFAELLIQNESNFFTLNGF